MQSLIIFVFGLFSLLGSALGNKVIFINKTPHDRVVCWYPGALPGTDPKNPQHYPPIPGTFVKAWGRGATPPIVWGGDYMFKSVYITTGEKGDCNSHHNVEGEVKFNGNYGYTWFDLSVVKTNEFGLGPQNEQIHWLRPAGGNYPLAGCSVFPCNNLFKFPGDTDYVLSTTQPELTAIICDGPCDSS
ncbi:hypothetical protein ONS95_003380 [Cadophora gregata]|uniref:uncharacterized protein n=1 Tax=Cadophora gregata TaxID=51156 RepID=UPI0026DBA4DF|nr:uncharacterized protein ONS95_003380 [Cadophora gregata]KAK0108583.1 hypothetical protein ONS95_003380 [Cadophora gregata]KAK0108824.1 hypothetical protein ONS96_002666 [Cadophora gregata f. sp. sojae]